MEKKITITMNQIDGSITTELEGGIAIAESLAMLEFAKMWIYQQWMEEVS